MNRIIFTRPNLALMAAIACVTVAGFWFIPANQELPLHWNWHGAIDAWGSRGRTLLLMPICGAAMIALFCVLGRWVLNVDELHGGRQSALGLSSVLAVFLAVQTMIVCYGLGYAVNGPRTIACVAGLFFIALGNILPKMQQNAVWPARLNSLDASQHRRIHRLTGGVMMASGLCVLIAAAFDISPPWLNSSIVAAAVLPAVIGNAYMLLLSKRASSG